MDDFLLFEKATCWRNFIDEFWDKFFGDFGLVTLFRQFKPDPAVLFLYSSSTIFRERA